MKVTKVCCQGCGADLQIDETIRYVTCNYCNARLEIVHDTTVTHSRQLDKIQRTTDHLAGKMKVLELQNDIERLDREWEKFREAVLPRDQTGQLCELHAGPAAVLGILGIALGLILFVGTLMNQEFGWSLLCLPVFAISIWIIKSSSKRAAAYQAQRFRYSSARRSLLHRLERARGTA